MITQNLSIPRMQEAHLLDQINNGRLLLLHGSSFLQKLDWVRSVIPAGKATHVVSEDQVLDLNEKENAWNLWLGEFDKNTLVIIERGELLKGLDSLLDATLNASFSPTVLILCDVVPAIDPLLIEALKANNLFIEFFPPSFYEIAQVKGLGSIEKELDQRLIYGSYPEVMENAHRAESILNHLVSEILNQSLSAKERVNKKAALKKTLQVFAFEMGNVISYNEVGTRVDLDNETVERYAQLFEKAGVLKILNSYNGGNKYEMKKGNTVFFVDNGIRNALINNFNPMEWRQDASQLWRNWLVMEKMKWNNILQRQTEMYTWRTHTGQKIDFLEKQGDNMVGYQCSWTKKRQPRFPASFGKYYPESKQAVVNRSTYWTLLSSKK